MPRPRKPTPMKILQGTDQPCRMNYDEPEYPKEIPEPTESLGPFALEEWMRVVPIMDSYGVLTTVDMAALEAYCRTYERWRRASDVLDAEGQMAFTEKGIPCKHPMVNVADSAGALMLRYMVEFGLTPASRSKVKATNNGKGKSEWDGFRKAKTS